MKREGVSAQYAENSMMDWGERRNGGAVREARSPLNVARLCEELLLVRCCAIEEGREIKTNNF